MHDLQLMLAVNAMLWIIIFWTVQALVGA